MKINICRIEDGPARVKVYDDEGAIVNEVDVNVGQEVTLASEGAIATGDVVETPAPEAPAVSGEQGAGEQPAQGEGGAAAEKPAPAPADVEGTPAVDASEIPEGLAPGRVVTFHTAVEDTDLPAVVSGTIASVPQSMIDSGDVPELTSPKRVHLTVISPSLADAAAAHGGTYQAFNVSLAPEVAEGEQIPGGTWRWPERV